MKKCAVFLLAAVAVFAACKKKKEFTEPRYVFSRWSKATESLNYSEYRKCEAYPKAEHVFREMYRESYLSNVMITDIQGIDDDKIHDKGEGEKYMKRSISFECSEVHRKTGRQRAVLRGDVDFIRFTGGKRSSEGWLMWNRKLVRIGR